jgi:hypothetical protein
MIIRTLSALLLATLLAASATSQTPAKDPPKGKESPKEVKDLPGGKSLKQWVQIAEKNLDAALREEALMVIASSFPADDIRKDEEVVKSLINRLNGEVDTSVRIALIDLFGALELRDPIDKDKAPHLLADIAVKLESRGGNAVRLHALQALGRYGHKAYGIIKVLEVDPVLKDPSSYEIRVALAQALGRIGHMENGSPSPIALSMLKGTLSVDQSAPVRLAAFESLFALGPPLKPANAKGPNGDPVLEPDYDGTVAKDMVTNIENRIKGLPATENDKQIEMWQRLVIVRFGGDFEKQLNGLAHYLEKSCKLTEQAITAIKNDNAIKVSDEVLRKLIPLKFRELAEPLFVKEVHRYVTPTEARDYLNTILSHSRIENSIAIKLQAIQLIGLMGEVAVPKLDLIISVLNDKEPILRVAALQTLGSVGEKIKDPIIRKEKTIDPIIRVIDDPKEEPEMRIAAMSGLSRLGEKAEGARGSLTKIIQDPANLDEPTPTRTALLQQALLTLASMGEKALSEVPILKTLSDQLLVAKEKRLKSPEHKKLVENPEYVRIMNRLSKEEKEKLEKNQPEDLFKKFVDEAIEFIRKSTPGHPGGEAKPSGEPKKP